MSISNNLRQAFEKFMAESFENTVDESTTVYNVDNSIIAVQLCVDGTYKVLWFGQDNDSNVYYSLPPGILIRVPFLFEGEVGYDDVRDFFAGQFENFIEHFV